MKKLLLLLIATSGIRTENIDLNEIDLSNVTYVVDEERVASYMEDDEKLLVRDDKFYIERDDLTIPIKPHRVDKLFNKRTTKDMIKFSALHKFKVDRFDNGEYGVRPVIGLHGGGGVGMYIGAIGGKFIVHFIGHGTIHLVALCTGPLYLATAASLEAALLPTVIEPLSNIVALAGGIAGGVATGPV